MRRALPFAMILGLLVAASAREAVLRTQLDTPFAADPAKEVVLLSTRWCGYCQQARSFLSHNGVRFSEYDVESSAAGRSAYAALRGGGVPILVVDGTPIRGVDVDSWIDALRLPASELARRRF